MANIIIMIKITISNTNKHILEKDYKTMQKVDLLILISN